MNDDQDLTVLLDDIEARARSAGLERRWQPTPGAHVYAGNGDPVLYPSDDAEADLAVAAQPRVLVALVAKVREMIAFIAEAHPVLRGSCSWLGGQLAEDEVARIDAAVVSTRKILVDP